jgi:hypothetical protein
VRNFFSSGVNMIVSPSSSRCAIRMRRGDSGQVFELGENGAVSARLAADWNIATRPAKRLICSNLV